MNRLNNLKKHLLTLLPILTEKEIVILKNLIQEDGTLGVNKTFYLYSNSRNAQIGLVFLDHYKLGRR